MGVPVAKFPLAFEHDQHVKAVLSRELVITIKQVALGQAGIDFPQALQDHPVIGTSPDGDSNEKLPVETLDEIDKLAFVVAGRACRGLTSVHWVHLLFMFYVPLTAAPISADLSAASRRSGSANIAGLRR